MWKPSLTSDRHPAPLEVDLPADAMERGRACPSADGIANPSAHSVRLAVPGTSEAWVPHAALRSGHHREEQGIGHRENHFSR